MKFVIHEEKLNPEVLSETGQTSFPIGQIPSWTTPQLHPTYHYSQKLQHFLQGKQLLFDELPFSIEEIHAHYVHGYISYRKGVVKEAGKYNCLRCGNQEKALFGSFQCARCENLCTYCRKCVMMGRVSECTPLIHWAGPVTNSSQNHDLNWNGSLSPGQKKASDAVVNAICHNEELLVWAVCGSGKTELLFQGIERALAQKKSVCIAAPRTDVVLELTPRLKAAFPKTNIIAYYGGSVERSQIAPLIISTTHQLIRFYKAFDVMIVDEVDAFPYSIDKMLTFAVKQAKKDLSTTIYLTATPNKTMKRRVKLKDLSVVTIPSRYHGHPLPVPCFRWCGNWRRLLAKQMLPSKVRSWIIQHIQTNKQVFLFVPSIQILEKTVHILKKFDARIEGVHAEDKKRKEKVMAFRIGEIPILVTTTILERGVTVPNVDVAVMGAEDDIFTESALVQISGRAGRSAAFPSGDILFFHYGKTKAMVEAKFHIEKMNWLAKHKKIRLH